MFVRASIHQKYYIYLLDTQKSNYMFVDAYATRFLPLFVSLHYVEILFVTHVLRSETLFFYLFSS